MVGNNGGRNDLYIQRNRVTLDGLDGVCHFHRIAPSLGQLQIGEGKGRCGGGFDDVSIFFPTIGQRTGACGLDCEGGVEALILSDRNRLSYNARREHDSGFCFATGC